MISQGEISTLSRRKKSATGIRAIRPHQIWHADISIFVTADNIKRYIYCVVDNYSRKILSCVAHNSVKAGLRSLTLFEAMKKVKGLRTPVILITDSGPENNLILPSFDHLKAMVDIQYSNSMIEAHNKIIKYNYLYRMEIKDDKQLNSILPKIVEDFNNRPHISLGGLTPNEAEQNIALNRKTLSENIRQSTMERKTYNQLHQCGHCKACCPSRYRKIPSQL